MNYLRQIYDKSETSNTTGNKRICSYKLVAPLYYRVMNDNQLDDLKQFIAASVSQSEERLRNEMNQGFEAVRQEFQAVRQEMADGFRGVGGQYVKLCVNWLSLAELPMRLASSTC